jgi:signal transduction histidine kinase
MKSFHQHGRYHFRTSWMPPGEAPAALDLRPGCGCNLPGFNRARPRSAGRSSRPRGGDGMIGEDVMAQNAETEQLREQLLRAQRLSSMGALASSVAHEFNNILTTIINYAKLGLGAEGDNRARSEALEKILKGSQRAATIVNSMLGFARNQAHQRELTDLAKLVEEVLILTEKDLSKHHVQVEKQFHERPQALVVPGQIEQILLNLIINARQAMPRGGHLRLELRENRLTHMAEIRVTDTGIGIPPDQLRLIFEPFYTTKQPDENGHGGNGLGLSVCRQIVEQHRGRIRVESVVGKGSTFTVKLPLEDRG